MKEYLIFRLYGPMAAWGEIAVGWYRPSFAYPSKSAVVGLVAAALGVTRDQEDLLVEMAESYSFAVEVEAPGGLLRDYHTVEVPRLLRGVSFYTRKEEVAAAQADRKANPIVSTRDYYCDALYTVCLWVNRDPAPFPMDAIRNSLERPHFPLYLGRKSCPPALPLCPRLVSADTLKEALDAAEFPDGEFLADLPRGRTVSIHWDELPDAGIEPQHVITRRDVPLSRTPWQSR